MKKNGILNGDISRVISYMGHTDTICIADCGLPIPEETERIDLALKKRVPSLREVLETVMAEMKIEKIVLAEEIKIYSPNLNEEIVQVTAELAPECLVEYVPHEDLKRQTKSCRAVVRTGEMTSFANVILQSGCLF